MFSGGQRPFEPICPKNFMDFLEAGGRPEFSQETPRELINILNDQCFEKNFSKRGTFVKLEQELGAFYSIVSSFFR
jgi:hypothetical protein